MLRTLALLVASAALALAAGPIEQIERDYGKALASNDTATLDRLLSSDLVYTHSGANTDTKTSYMASLKSGAQRYNLFEYESLDSKTYGDAAVVYAVIHVKSDTKGVASESHLKVIHVWINKGGSWQLVAHQSTKLPS